MTPETEDRKARATKLGEAIEVYLEGQEFEGMLGDWMLIGSVVHVDDDGDPDAEYFVALSGGSMLQHIVLGLIAKAEDVLAVGEEG